MIVGAPRHVLAVSLLIVEVFGIPSSKVPTEIVQFPHLRSQGVAASRHSPLVCRRMRELQDDKLPCHGFGKGESLGFSAQRKAIVVAFNRAGIRLTPVKLCFWTLGSLLFARLGWLFRHMQGRATPAGIRSNMHI